MQECAVQFSGSVSPNGGMFRRADLRDLPSLDSDPYDAAQTRALPIHDISNDGSDFASAARPAIQTEGHNKC